MPIALLIDLRYCTIWRHERACTLLARHLRVQHGRRGQALKRRHGGGRTDPDEQHSIVPEAE